MFPPIAELIPHRERMLLVDRVLSFEGEQVVAELTVRDDPLFCSDGLVGSWVGLEYMAQTVGAMIGLMSRERGEPVRIGLLLGTRRFSAQVAAFRPGQTLRVEATQAFIADNGLAAFDARILDQDRVLAEATLSAFQPEDVQAFLREVEA
ncbi:hypothetical protein [Niveibacterium terrae]|uniref:ApeP family dehydratase n=1 Tax=Niveibacterium terrae TaxID=3373598 RepID=UPI003A8F09AE